jgi:hypothetical protein
MKVKDLISKLQALNPEAEVYVYSGCECDDLYAADTINSAVLRPKWTTPDAAYPVRDPDPSDMLIVLS